MSLHSKVFIGLALMSHIAISAMAFIAVDPNYLPTAAVAMVPYAWGLSVLAAISYACDLLTGEAR